MNSNTRHKSTQRVGPQALEPQRRACWHLTSFCLLVATLSAWGQAGINTNFPTDLVVSVGDEATFRIMLISGQPPYAVQWYRDQAPIDGATNVSLSLVNVQLTDSGSSFYGVVTDQSNVPTTTRVATLTVTIGPFVKVSGQPIVTDVEASVAGLWCDYDGDGFMDVFVPNSSNNSSEVRSSLYHNEGDGTFTRVTNSLTSDANNIWGCAWGDYDNDGHPDLLQVQWGIQPAQLYRNGGGGAFSLVTTFDLVDDPVDCAWADLDGDGWLDLFVGTWQQAVDLAYRNLGNGTFRRCTVIDAGALVTEAKSSASASFADIDNDGDLDVYVNCDNNVPSLHRNLGTGKFEIAVLGSLPGTAYTVSGVWGDFNNDGFFDLFTTGLNGIEGKLHLNVEGREFQDVTTTAGLVTPARLAFGPAWGDYDNDGDLDLFIPYYNDPNMLFRNNGDGTFTSVNVGSPNLMGVKDTGAVWVDYDNDGFLDLFLACGEANPSPNRLYRNNLPATGNQNHWLKVRLTGIASNRMAIGAKVRVRAVVGGRETWQLRQIASNGAFASGGEFVAHFGLGDATHVETLRIGWPSGIVQELSNVAPDQFLTVTEARNEQTPTPPEVTAYTRAADGTFQATVNLEETGVRAVLEATSDMVHWAKVMMRTNVTGTMEFSDAPVTPSRPMRFYRVVVP